MSVMISSARYRIASPGRDISAAVLVAIITFVFAVTATDLLALSAYTGKVTLSAANVFWQCRPYTFC